jgi:hypothetical protein
MLRAYRPDWADFTALCASAGLDALPGDEPERHALWRHGEEASAELANIPDTPELRAADEDPQSSP